MQTQKPKPKSVQKYNQIGRAYQIGKQKPDLNKLKDYLNQKKQNRNQSQGRVLEQVEQEQVNKPQGKIEKSRIQEGLLGKMGDYESMTKEQLIEKLVVAEQLMKKLYRENMQMKEQMKEQMKNAQM